eukprot:scaffold103203_cov69-Phaeocystis_antarctica.AAC.2
MRMYVGNGAGACGILIQVVSSACGRRHCIVDQALRFVIYTGRHHWVVGQALGHSGGGEGDRLRDLELVTDARHELGDVALPDQGARATSVRGVLYIAPGA